MLLSISEGENIENKELNQELNEKISSKKNNNLKYFRKYCFQEGMTLIKEMV